MPTWNYEVVHVHGTVRVRDETAFVDSVVRSLTDLHEARRVANSSAPGALPTLPALPALPAWSVDDAPPEFTTRQLRAIVGIEMTVTRIEAKRKLSQNRSDPDRRGVVDGLGASPDRRSQTVAAVMHADLPHG